MKAVLLVVSVVAFLGGVPRAEAASGSLEPGNQIVYVSTEEDAAGEIHLLNASGDSRLTNNTFSDGYPQLSPDGTMIAFYSNRDGNAEIYVMNIDGTNQTNVTNNAAADYGVTWSPDGTKLAFRSDRDGSPDIYVMNVDGSNPVNLTNQPGSSEWSPDWSPDGAHILFISDRDGNDEIYGMGADGSNQVNLTNDSGGDYGPRWSPDGATITFQSNRDGDLEIFSMGSDGSNPTQLTNNTSDDYGAAWSPDGTRLAYVAAAPGGNDIWVMDADGSNPGALITGSGTQTIPDWSSVPPRFLDVDFGHTFYADIDWLAAQGITKGCNPPDNTLYCPDDPVTRGQMAAFLVRALGYTDDGGGGLFVDTAGSVFRTDIDRLRTAAVTKGCNPPVNDMFCPDDSVTRGQMAAFLHRALGGTLTPGAAVSFTDDDGSVFETDIEWLGATGITKGCNPPVNDMFCPAQQVTRAQMAAFLHRALG
jgi:Tol biopolymer transport system component